MTCTPSYGTPSAGKRETLMPYGASGRDTSRRLAAMGS